MYTKLKLLILFIGITTMSTQCAREEYDCQGYTSYVIETAGNHFVPESDSIRIGDTLRVIYDEPDHPVDVNTGKTVDLSTFESFSNYLAINHLDTNRTGNWSRALTPTFLKYGSEKGKILVDPRFKDLSLGVSPMISNGRCQYTVWYVFKEKGVYAMSFNDAGPAYKKNGNQKDCEAAGFRVGVQNTDRHMELYIRYRPDYVPKTDVEKYHTYCFEVY